MTDDTGKEVKIDEDGIAWDAETDRRFKRLDDDWETEQWLDVEDEHFIVWMRTSAFPLVRKMWGKIDDDLDKGTYKITIVNNYDSDEWDGEKWIIVSTVTGMGGDNTPFGIILILFGVISLIMALVLVLKAFVCKKNAPLNPAEESSLI
jgi:hypothetical protein